MRARNDDGRRRGGERGRKICKPIARNSADRHELFIKLWNQPRDKHHGGTYFTELYKTASPNVSSGNPSTVQCVFCACSGWYIPRFCLILYRSKELGAIVAPSSFSVQVYSWMNYICTWPILQK